MSAAPSLSTYPPAASTERAEEAIQIAGEAGLTLDGWQRTTLERAMGTTANRWAAFEVGVNVPRQNGKDALLEVRELAELYSTLMVSPPDGRLVIHSAHQFDTSLEHFRRLLSLIENSDRLRADVKRVSKSHGEEGIELLNGNRIRFRTRTKGGGRGFSGDLILFNEAMVLAEWSHGALLPTLSAREDPQVWYTGSAVDQQVHDHGVVFTRVRLRALAGGDPSLAYFEWSLPGFDNPDQVPLDRLEDTAGWAYANPALGIRIAESHILAELRTMNRRTFAVERLGVGDYPDPTEVDRRPFTVADWTALADARSSMLDPVVLAYDVTPDRRHAAIAAAGARSDGLVHVEIVDQRTGTGWLPDRIAGLAERHDVAAIVCDSASPAASLVPELERLGLTVRMLTAGEYAQACGRLVDAVDQRTVRHLGSSELVEAVDGAKTRPLGDAWAWSRRNSDANISPLVAVTVAVFVVAVEGPSVYEERDVVVV